MGQGDVFGLEKGSGGLPSSCWVWGLMVYGLEVWIGIWAGDDEI